MGINWSHVGRLFLLHTLHCVCVCVCVCEGGRGGYSSVVISKIHKVSFTFFLSVAPKEMTSETDCERGSRSAAERGSLAGEKEDRGSTTSAAPDSGSTTGADSASLCLAALPDLVFTVVVSTLCVHEEGG